MKSNFVIIGIILLLIGVITFSGCAQYPNTIIIQNSTFNPPEKNITAGTTITWINNDSVTHTVVSDTGTFQNITLNPRERFDYTFYGEGEFTYHDSVNPSMTGKINVARPKGF